VVLWLESQCSPPTTQTSHQRRKEELVPQSSKLYTFGGEHSIPLYCMKLGLLVKILHRTSERCLLLPLYQCPLVFVIRLFHDSISHFWRLLLPTVSHMFVPHSDSVSRLQRTLDGFPECVELPLQLVLVEIRVYIDGCLFSRTRYTRRYYAVDDTVDGCGVPIGVEVTIPAAEFLA
jgi:hypothetical protein